MNETNHLSTGAGSHIKQTKRPFFCFKDCGTSVVLEKLGSKRKENPHRKRVCLILVAAQSRNALGMWNCAKIKGRLVVIICLQENVSSSFAAAERRRPCTISPCSHSDKTLWDSPAWPTNTATPGCKNPSGGSSWSCRGWNYTVMSTPTTRGSRAARRVEPPSTFTACEAQCLSREQKAFRWLH